MSDEQPAPRDSGAGSPATGPDGRRPFKEWHGDMVRASGITDAQYRVYDVIRSHAAGDGTGSHPSLQQLSREAGGKAENTILGALRKLRAAGYVAQVSKGGPADDNRTGGRASVYRLAVPVDVLANLAHASPQWATHARQHWSPEQAAMAPASTQVNASNDGASSEAPEGRPLSNCGDPSPQQMRGPVPSAIEGPVDPHVNHHVNPSYTSPAAPTTSETRPTITEPTRQDVLDAVQDAAVTGQTTEDLLDLIRRRYGPELAAYVDVPGWTWPRAAARRQDRLDQHAARYAAAAQLNKLMHTAHRDGHHVRHLDDAKARTDRPRQSYGREDVPGIEAEVEQLRESGELHPDVVAGIARLEATTQPPLDGLAAVAVPDRPTASPETRQPARQHPAPPRTTGDTMDPSQNASEPHSAPRPDPDRLARLIRAGSITSSPEPEPPQWQPWTA
ncbi:hypothetical protein [Kocuria rosea]|uniref:hypothetical protein n=1 Tax=Kocuria rosea TaxID=1275 RepID=UPI003018B0F1